MQNKRLLLLVLFTIVVGSAFCGTIGERYTSMIGNDVVVVLDVGFNSYNSISTGLLIEVGTDYIIVEATEKRSKGVEMKVEHIIAFNKILKVRFEK